MSTVLCVRYELSGIISEIGAENRVSELSSSPRGPRDNRLSAPRAVYVFEFSYLIFTHTRTRTRNYYLFAMVCVRVYAISPISCVDLNIVVSLLKSYWIKSSYLYFSLSHLYPQLNMTRRARSQAYSGTCIKCLRFNQFFLYMKYILFHDLIYYY